MAGGLKLSIKSKFFFNESKVFDPMRKQTEKSLFKVGGFLRTTARRSITSKQFESAPGTPPHFRKSLTIFFIRTFDERGEGRFEFTGKDAREKATEFAKASGTKVEREKVPIKRGGALKKSISFLVNRSKLKVEIGPAFSKAARTGGLHEFGGKSRKLKGRYPARPFMKPALDKASRSGKLASFWNDVLS